jgi:intracellular septation protein
MKLLLELGPLVLFFVANARFGIRVATAAFVVALLLALPLAWRQAGRMPLVPVITAVFVLVFGGLTIALDDELFIQLKPTVASVFFAGAILIGLARGKLLLKAMLGEAMRLDDEGWRILSVRWVGYFVVLAALNELVRLNLSLDQWVAFKTFGILPLTVVFTLTQLGVMQRHELPEPGEAPADGAE